MNTLNRIVLGLKLFERRVFRHYKGGYYVVVTWDAFDEGGRGAQTVYVCLRTMRVYVRPTQEFQGNVRVEGRPKKRFVKAGKAHLILARKYWNRP